MSACFKTLTIVLPFGIDLDFSFGLVVVAACVTNGLGSRPQSYLPVRQDGGSAKHVKP